jgi:hypothetical protein
VKQSDGVDIDKLFFVAISGYTVFYHVNMNKLFTVYLNFNRLGYIWLHFSEMPGECWLMDEVVCHSENWDFRRSIFQLTRRKIMV